MLRILGLLFLGFVTLIVLWVAIAWIHNDIKNAEMPQTKVGYIVLLGDKKYVIPFSAGPEIYQVDHILSHEGVLYEPEKGGVVNDVSENVAGSIIKISLQQNYDNSSPYVTMDERAFLNKYNGHGKIFKITNSLYQTNTNLLASSYYVGWLNDKDGVIIECASNDPKFGMCSYYYTYDGLFIGVLCSPKEILDWKKIIDNTDDFIDRARVK
jgi:hypothetical protein